MISCHNHRHAITLLAIPPHPILVSQQKKLRRLESLRYIIPINYRRAVSCLATGSGIFVEMRVRLIRMSRNECSAQCTHLKTNINVNYE